MTTGAETQPIPFGPFELTERLGAGGMGEVWTGVHVVQRVPVAIKFLHPRRMDAQRFHRAFTNEVQAVARMNHPSIPMVFDFGEVPEAVDSLSQGQIKAGAPYLVMELFTGGSLHDRIPTSDWEWVKTILLALLDTLAFAHARGVIHRDVKPSNVLFTDHEPTNVSPKLIDFGLASLMDMGLLEESQLDAGTPAFQAPEQIIRQSFRDQGPWTDLYALGCLAFTMVSGRYPYLGQTDEETWEQQLTRRIPELKPLFPVPAGFGVWLGHLMAKAPGDRYQRAADAAYGLTRLGELQAAWRTTFPPPLPPRVGSTQPTLAAKYPNQLTTLASVVTEASDINPTVSTAPKRSFEGTGAPPSSIAPTPEDWRRNEPPPTSMKLIGAGLSLYGLRSIPLVDRDQERDEMWQTLLDVTQDRKTRLLLLHGLAGTGKSRLAHWLAERAHEVSAATTLKAVHSPHSSPGEGLARMFDRFLNCIGLTREQTQSRITRLLRERGETRPFTKDLLADFLRPDTSAPVEESAKLVSVSSYYSVLLETLRLYARERCLLVWLDDVQWGSDAIAFTQHAFGTVMDDQAPILFLMTVQEEALAERELETTQLDQLLDRSAAIRIPVGPLPVAHRPQLIHELLNIEGELAHMVNTRTRGNPLFAVQLVGDWVSRGVLEVGQTGFTLRPGEEAVVPDDIYAIWLTRVHRVFETSVEVSQGTGDFEKSLIALELAAVLGQEVDQEEWLDLCRSSSTVIPPRLVDGLCANRLAERTETGWQFAHNMLRESMERSAREAGRLSLHHQRCAQMLKDRYPKWQLGLSERIGQHLLDAGRSGEALEPIERAVREHLRTSDPHQAVRLARAHRRAVESLDLPLKHPNRLRTILLEIRCAIFLGQKLAFHGGQIDNTIDLAEACPDANLFLECLYVLALLEYHRGQLKHAQEILKRTIAVAEKQSEQHPVLMVSLGLIGDVELRLGNQAKSSRYLDKAHALATACNAFDIQAKVLVGMARISANRGDLDSAFAHIEQARVLFEQVDNRWGEGNCLGSMGDFERRRGNLDEAAKCQRAALEINTTFSPERAGYDLLNLSHVLIRQKKFGEAKETLNKVIQRAQAADQPGLVASATCALLASLAGEQQWKTFAQTSRTAKELLAETDFSEYDDAESLEIAGDLAAGAGKPGHAKMAYPMALTMWQKLKIEEREDRVKRALKDLS